MLWQNEPSHYLGPVQPKVVLGFPGVRIEGDKEPVYVRVVAFVIGAGKRRAFISISSGIFQLIALYAAQLPTII